MATTVSYPIDGGIKGLDVEIVNIVWESTDATEEVTTGLSEIYAVVGGGVLFGANAGHTDDDCGLIEIDEALSGGAIAVSSGAITVNRIATNAAGTLAGQNTCLVLYGKS